MLLINPTGERYGGTLSKFVPLSVPISVGCLAAQMRAHGHAVRVIDEELEPIDPNRLDLSVQGLPRPYVIGLSVLTAQAHRAYELAGMFKAKYPDATVILGGYHATALPEEALGFESIDFVVSGEGERTLLKLYETIRSGERDFSKVEGIVYRENGKIIRTPPAPLIRDLDSLPPFPYDLFSNPRYDHGFILSSRGCPYRCNYCNMRMMTGNTYRFRSAKSIVGELDILIHQFHTRQIFFIDDNFCFKKKRVKELCAAMIEARYHRKCEFSLQTRADNLYADIIPCLKEAGFTSVGFGMETGVDRLGKIINKEETVQQHQDAVAAARKEGLDVAIFMIYGLPTETPEERAESYRVCREMKPTFLKFNNLMPYPGTPFYNDVKESGRMTNQDHWKNFLSTLADLGTFILNHPPLPYVPETASEWELKRDIVRYNVKAQLRWTSIKTVLTRKHGPGWFKLRSKWYLFPSQWYHLIRISAILAANLFIVLLPLKWMERFLEYYKPWMKKKIPRSEQTEYLPSGWDHITQKKVLA